MVAAFTAAASTVAVVMAAVVMAGIADADTGRRPVTTAAEPLFVKLDRRPLTERERLYASGNRKRDNLAPSLPDPRPRTRLYAKPRHTSE
jgi:hypothetical protein